MCIDRETKAADDEPRMSEAGETVVLSLRELEAERTVLLAVLGETVDPSCLPAIDMVRSVMERGHRISERAKNRAEILVCRHVYDLLPAHLQFRANLALEAITGFPRERVPF